MHANFPSEHQNSLGLEYIKVTDLSADIPANWTLLRYRSHFEGCTLR